LSQTKQKDRRLLVHSRKDKTKSMEQKVGEISLHLELVYVVLNVGIKGW
jgi:hypothetical protein